MYIYPNKKLYMSKVDWKRAKTIAYFSDLKINKAEDLEYIYTVKHLVELSSDYRNCSYLIKKEEEELTTDKNEYINAINDLKKIVSKNIYGDDKNFWLDINKILEKKYKDVDIYVESNPDKPNENDN